MKKYADRIVREEYDLIRLTMEYLCMMYAPEKVRHLLVSEDETVTRWILYEKCGVYQLTTLNSRYEFYLAEREYEHGAYYAECKMGGSWNARVG